VLATRNRKSTSIPQAPARLVRALQQTSFGGSDSPSHMMERFVPHCRDIAGPCPGALHGHNLLTSACVSQSDARQIVDPSMPHLDHNLAAVYCTMPFAESIRLEKLYKRHFFLFACADVQMRAYVCWRAIHQHSSPSCKMAARSLCYPLGARFALVARHYLMFIHSSSLRESCAAHTQ
jgi:hypothetical protein